MSSYFRENNKGIKLHNWEDIYNFSHKKLYAIVYSIAQNREIAEDAVQEAFYNALSKSDQLKDLDKFEAWLISIAVNKVKDILRRSSNVTTVADIGEVLEFNRELLHDPGFDSIELQDEVKRILNRLELRDRELLVLRYSMDLSFDKIAEVLEISPQTVRARLMRTKRKSRKIIGLDTRSEGAAGGDT